MRISGVTLSLFYKDKVNNSENFFLSKPNILSSPNSPQKSIAS